MQSPTSPIDEPPLPLNSTPLPIEPGIINHKAAPALPSESVSTAHEKLAQLGLEDPEEDDSDYEYDEGRVFEENPARPAKQQSEKSRRDAAAFHSWLETKERQNYDEAVVAVDAANQVRESPERWPLERDMAIIRSPREYQVELFERAKVRNTIVVLDTGAGKTLIAALLMRHILNQELEDRAVGKPKKVAFFIAEKVALCDQQHRVLSHNIEFSIGKLHGDSPGMTSSSDFWDGQVNEHMAIVCTAQLLLDGLNHGFITMRGINLLIFDEAHHAKKNHAFARIIQTYYRGEPDQSQRPRIFGMTASPADGQIRDMKDACGELEAMLDSRIATVSDEVLRKSLEQKRLVESVETFKCLLDPEEAQTVLWTRIYDQVSSNAYFRPSLDFSNWAASHLGPWCADRFWSLLLTDAEVAKLTAKTEQEFGHTATQRGVSSDDAISAIITVKDLVNNLHMAPITRHSGLLSSKVERLWDILDGEFRQSPTKRCIVFVEKQYTAFMLANLMQQPSMRIPGLNASYMVGSGTSSIGASMSLREQVTTLRGFREGDINCLFATPVAEEGIDIPSCDLVIRFDLYNSVIQYIQSRGRARRLDSKYISIIEEDNRKDLRRLSQATRDAKILQQFCAALPEDRKMQDQLGEIWAAAAAAQAAQKKFDTKAGARLSFDNSLAVLSKFVSSMSTRWGNSSPDFVVMPTEQKFIAEVILPDFSPVSRVSGYPQRGKQLARSSAAFEACLLLLQQKHIDEHLQPTLAKKLPYMRNARLAVSSKKKADYEMKVKPTIWSRVGGEPALELFVAILALEEPNKLGRRTRPLLMLTRERLPSLAPIPLFFGDGNGSMVQPIVSETPLQVTMTQVESLRYCTLKIFDDIFSKGYEAECSEFPYFLAPERESHGVVRKRKSASVDWDLIEEMQKAEFLKWDDQPDDFYHDKFVVDPYDGSRKIIILGINKQLKPSDPEPEGAPLPRSRAFRISDKSVKNYSISLWQKAAARRTWREDQPVVNAETLPLRRNFLDQFFIDDTANRKCAVILEPLNVSPIPVDVVMMVLFFPSILHRIDAQLITLDACKMLDLQIRPDLALEAMTKDSDNTDDHGTEQINFQAGMGRNYERLEFLGDTFLKMATTISIFTLQPDEDEFHYHVERMLLLCNQNLFNHALERNLQEYIRSQAFDRRSWYPNLKLLRGKAPQGEQRHNLADKTIADVCEALIGAAYFSSADGGMDMAVKAVTKMVRSKNHNMLKFQDYYAKFQVPSWHCLEQPPKSYHLTAGAVEAAVGYRFKSVSLARSAFKHSSWQYDREIPSYQQLEFLGDALLDMTFVDYLYRQFPEADPQWLTEHKMVMASNQFLGFLCVKLGLQTQLQTMTAHLMSQVSDYVTDLEKAEEMMEREAADGADRRVDFWLDVSAAPKALPDVVEALVGAMFVDSGYDFDVVRRFAQDHVLPYFSDMVRYDTFASRHPVTLLSSHLRNDLGCRNWRLCCSNVPCGVEEGIKAVTESEVVCALLVHENVVAHATAQNSRSAKAMAAKKAGRMLAELDASAYRSKYGCDCKGSV